MSSSGGSRDGALEVITPPRAGSNHRFRDELNFAEFPIAAVSDTVADNVKTLEFTDDIFDPSSGKTVQRTLSITAADKFGLPTALDDEVLLGLIQLSCDEDFRDRKVHFSRYGLIKLLGWRDDSKSYKRVEDSLNRWAGVTLQYQKAWWSKEEQCWVNETFHVIDQVTVYDRERIERRRKMAKGQPEKALSSFVWNETVFQSFKVGYIKSLDFDFFKSLRSAISKRMYRFLDKRFYHKGRWEFDLRVFACEKCGLSKNAPNAELKRKLLPAVRELEERGFLTSMPEGERFRPSSRGNWTVTFVKAAKKVAVLARPEEPDRLVEELVSRGITRRSAEKLLSYHPRERIEEKIRLDDWSKGRGEGSAIRNRAGWLYSAIVNDYAAPPEMTGVVRSGAQGASPSARPEAQATPRAAPSSEPTVRDAADAPFDAYWAGLSESEREEFERTAVSEASPFHRKNYLKDQEVRGSLWAVLRRKILTDHFARASSKNTNDA